MKRDKLIGSIMVWLGAILLIMMTIWFNTIAAISDKAHLIGLVVYSLVTFGISIPLIMAGILFNKDERREQ